MENDPTTRFTKVVDTDNSDEIVAFGRWHRYLNGAEHPGSLEISGLKGPNDPAIWPEGFNKEAFLGFFDMCLGERKSWMGEGRYWGKYRPLPFASCWFC